MTSNTGGWLRSFHIVLPSNDNVGNESVVAMAESLKHNKTLQSLDDASFCMEHIDSLGSRADSPLEQLATRRARSPGTGARIRGF